MTENNKIEVKFQGGQADLGRLHFYEYSRSQYALARFVSTIENYRRHERIAERITNQSYVDIYVEIPKRGSFISEIVVPIFTGAGGNLLSIPFSAFFRYVFDSIIPKATENRISDSTISKIAEIRLREIEREEKRDSLALAGC